MDSLLKNIKEIRKGGFSTIYSATWIDGARAISIDYNIESFVYCSSRGPSFSSFKNILWKEKLKILETIALDIYKFTKYYFCKRMAISSTGNFDCYMVWATIPENFSTKYAEMRLEYFGTCSYCKKFNSVSNLRSAKSPMSGFKVDDFLNEIQHKITTYESTIEWIPFDRLENIKEIGKGGFSIVYSTTWIDGRTIEYSTDSLS
ncbi:hypothetical protein Glove_326g193 [Diversispora epigaea]|uniref:Protein kinase domain-containing protein n=1 Tax=Diversispora epigaea TaxID=1348612 RepID=A0A397HLY8_9GLOM|nr:hypothetical protein Glove_326g193 [Diversispora epigaea]